MTKKMSVTLLACSWWFCIVVAHCTQPPLLISQYGHAVWRLEDGLSNAAPNVITQSSDGYIWIGTETGLLRFDGVRFVPWRPQHWEALFDHTVDVLYAATDGTLWIGTPTNLASWKNGVLTIINTDGPVYVNQITETGDHSIWFSTTRRADRKGICRVIGTAAKCFGFADPLTLGGVTTFTANNDGSLTLAFDAALLRWSPKAGLLATHKATTYARAGGTEIVALENQLDGSTLVGFEGAGEGRGLQRLSGFSWSSYRATGLNGSALALQTFFTDRHGSLWIGTRDAGIYRVVNNSVEHYDKRSGLSGNSIRDFHEDHEGNLWVATEGGIDCFRHLKTVTWSSDQGLTAGHVHAVMATHENGALVGIDHTLSLIHGDNISQLPIVPGLSDGFVNGILEDSLGRYWFGIDDQLVIYHNHHFSILKRPNGQSIGSVYSMSLAPDGSVWALLYPGTHPRELLHIANDRVIESVRAPFGLRVISDHADGAWINGPGRIAHHVNGRTTWIPLVAHAEANNFSVQDDLAASMTGSVFVSSRLGLWIVKDGKPRLVDKSAGLPCQDVNGLVLSHEKSLWMRTTCGLIIIEAKAIDSWWSDPESRIRYSLIGPSEGARPSKTLFFPQMSLAPNGNIWIGYDSGVQMIDPSHITSNPLPPPVHIEEIIADGETRIAGADLEFHPLVHDLEVRYTALSFVMPRNVKFKYMLEGRESSWQDPGSRRSAFYNDLKPGHYRFRVIAANNDGLWNSTGDTLDFYVKPAWFQTVWSRAFVLVVAITITWFLYRLRVGYIADTIKVRFRERLDERTRLARELHDTLLQTVQGSKMVADNALSMDADQARMRSALEGLSIWLEQAVTEGRSAVHALRESTLEQNELAESLDSVLKDHCSASSAPTANLTVTGEPRHLNHVVRDELSLIAREAIRNVCLHSKATEVRLELAFADELRLSIKDNGIGIDSNILESGKPGHFGLQSMKERSARIHATLVISSASKRGTEIFLRVPNTIAYTRAQQIKRFGLKRLLQLVSPRDRQSRKGN